MFNRLFFFLILISFVSCFKKKENNANWNTMNFPLESDIESLDPAISYDQVSGYIVNQLYESLYEYEYLKRPYTLRPLLAESMPSISSDQRTYTIKIKNNIYYNSKHLKEKTLLEAKHFINQIKRLAFKGTNSPGFYFVDGIILGINKWRDEVGSDLEKMLSTPISGIKALDAHTLEIKLTKPYPSFTYALAMSFTAPIPTEAIRKFKNNLHDKIIGTGPYTLAKWNQKFEVILKRNPIYKHSFYPTNGDRFSRDNNLLTDQGKSLPFIDTIHFKTIKEDSTRWFNFRKNKIDMIYIPKDQFLSAFKNGELSDELKKDGIKYQNIPTLTYWWLAYNMKDELLGKNKNLRLAIAHAVDTKEFIRLFTANTGLKSNSLLPPGIFGYDPTQELPYSYDLKKAKKYLELAGYPSAENLPAIKYDTRTSNTTDVQRGEFIRNQLSKIGIKIEIITNSFPSFLKKAKTGQMQFWLGGWALDYPDATNGLKLLSTSHLPPGSNSSQFSSPQFDELFNKIKVMQNTSERRKMIQEMEDIFFENHPWTLLFYRRRNVLSHKKLQNFRFDELISNDMKYWRITPKS